jgi:TRAP-type mannitol/chloroaromatic compound transport system permease small subunit
MQETVTWMHAAVFMLGAAWALRSGDHVRVDVFYKKMSPRRQGWVDLLGTVFFLLPLCGYIFFESLPYVQQSWEIGERSREASGMPGLYLLKTLIPLTALLLALQGVSDMVRAARRIRGN